jgi:hypothetical protein
MKQGAGFKYMNFLDQYLQRSQEIIGDRSPAEKRYDNEVLRWLRKGKNIRKAIEKANKKYPEEALEIDDTNSDDVADHYDYIMQHQEIMNKISSSSN